MYTRDVLLNDLRESVIEVIFKKVDGTERTMWCTLRSDLLPATYINEQDQERNFHKENKDTIAAWDVQKGGWRSFRVDNVLSTQVKDNSI